ncbi:S1C family serine protease [Kroppenstedtia sanguinis]|uniref:S1C family serine protease n=1 Tax=Kroppenstedtia sanguinis TaxID=1380684 RepID=A0ABW4CCZ8_9BACL
MGFYDRSDRTRKRDFHLLTGLVSGLVGGILALTLFTQTPLFSPNPSVGSRAVEEKAGPVQKVSVDVDSNITEGVKKVQPAVVGIVNRKKNEDPFGLQSEEQGTGSGIIFEKKEGKARVVTNHHVVAGSDEVIVVVHDGKTEKKVKGQVLGSDEITDLAVLEIPDKQVTSVAQFGNSDTLKAGEPAVAIGNPLGIEFSQSVTAGVISSPHRKINISGHLSMEVIQTDAAINPGNSGGALINTAGQVIGINSMKVSKEGVEGLGFAIPANEAQPILDQLIQYGKVKRPFMGIALKDLDTIAATDRQITLQLPDSVTDGVVILDVTPSSSASKAGLRRLDVIVALDDERIKNGSQLQSYLQKEKKIGERMKVTYYRNGKKQNTTVTLQEG